MAATSMLGTIPNWILIGIALIAAWRLSRGGAGSAVTELSKANEVLTQRVNELGGEVRDLRLENEQLRSKTDFAAVIAEHENRALDRHERTLAAIDGQLGVLDLIAQRLGPEPNHT